MDKKKLAYHLDFANHHPDSTTADIKKLCATVLKYGFHSAFVNPCYVSLASKILKGRATVGTVVSFPQGQDSVAAKVASAVDSARAGANELDVQMNVGAFKEGKYDAVLGGMKQIVRAVKKTNKKTLVKFIIETGYLTDKEIMKASELVMKSGADFVKTCSGYGPRGALIKDVTLIRKVVGNKMWVKVAGGVSTTEQALAFLNAGADRIGTSKAIEIVEGRIPKESGKGSE